MTQMPVFWRLQTLQIQFGFRLVFIAKLFRSVPFKGDLYIQLRTDRRYCEKLFFPKNKNFTKLFLTFLSEYAIIIK